MFRESQRGFDSSDQDVNYITNKLIEMGRQILSVKVVGDYQYEVLDNYGKVWKLDYRSRH